MGIRRTAALVLAAGLVLNAGLAQGGENKGRGEKLEIGAEVPMAAVAMQNVDGRSLSIADVKGENGTLVIFSGNACPWVRAWEDRIAAIGNTYREKGIGVIVINANDPDRVSEDGFEEMVERAKAKGFVFPYVVDATSDVARAFGATRTPEVFLFGPDGKLVYHGAIDDNARQPEKVEAHYLKDALDAVLAGKTVPKRETRALGCTVKFRPKT